MPSFSSSLADFLAESSSSCISDSWSCRSLISVWYCSRSIFTWKSLTTRAACEKTHPAHLRLNSHNCATVLGPSVGPREQSVLKRRRNWCWTNNAWRHREGDWRVMWGPSLNSVREYFAQQQFLCWGVNLIEKKKWPQKNWELQIGVI